MADKTTIARPYARAAFDESKAHGGLTAWSEALAAGAVAVRDPRVATLLDNPKVSRADLAQLVISIAAGKLDQAGGNFIRTLAENRRLHVLPEISVLFEALKNEAEGVADVTVTSAVQLTPPQLKSLEDALAKRLKRKVRLHTQLDPALIGGAVVSSGDLVIDGSLKGRLERIAHELTA
jgi:F-type H+-transporting ATPase subunit delta